MGCDIHMYIEYRNKQYAERNWRSFGSEINPGRNYGLFSLLAGVRGSSHNSLEPKGILEPDKLGWAASGDCYFYVVPDSDDNTPGTASNQTATDWERNCGSIRFGDYISHPDWHSHSWLGVDELEKVFSIYTQSEGQLNLEYLAVLAAMKALEDSGRNEVRVVFWFDN